MRFAFAVLLVVCLAAVALASPAKNKQAPACSRSCGDYEPICAKAKNSNKNHLLTFGNECVMDNYNCQHSEEPFEFKSKGECGGNVSVRLS